MELLNPTMTVTNTDGEHWLVRMQHQFGDVERLDVTLLVPRSDQPLAQVQQQLLRLLQARLSAMTSRS